MYWKAGHPFDIKGTLTRPLAGNVQKPFSTFLFFLSAQLQIPNYQGFSTNDTGRTQSV
jgi:hypothetical protein